MKITLDIPDWADERHIRILAGIELVAFKLAQEDHFKVKDVRCDWCGDCCTGFTQEKHFFNVTDNGECEHLQKADRFGRRVCSVAINRPHACTNDPVHLIERGECPITYKVVK